MKKKPLGHKSYGHIPHLPGSRMGPADKHCSDGQKKICCEKARDRHDTIIVQEKLDGGNVGVAKINNNIIALTRSGYTAITSPYEQHHMFDKWVIKNKHRFLDLLKNGERLCGEWMIQACGTIYDLPHEPFVAFDLMIKTERKPFLELKERVEKYDFIIPNTIHIGGPLSIDDAMKRLEKSGHGACEKVEGAVWRVERNKMDKKNQGKDRSIVVDFLAKYVRPDKKDGIYLPDISGREAIYNKHR
jgi:hypothetical protein